MIATSQPSNPASTNLADEAAQGADNAIKATQRVTNDALNSLSDKLQGARERAAPVLDRVASKAEELARRSAEAMRESTAQIKDRAQRASDATVSYIKDEPIKSVLIAAAAGAAIMAVAALLTRDRH